MISIPSFAKINLGLKIGSSRPDGFHELRTVYQTIAPHDILRVHLDTGSGIEIRCDDPRVPLDESNTCYRIAQRVVSGTPVQGRVVIEIEKHLPVQGGMGAASSNAVATMLALERALKLEIPVDTKLRIAAEVGSDLPLFLIGGTVLGVGRGGKDSPVLEIVIVTPSVGVSTPEAFARWDELMRRSNGPPEQQLTAWERPRTINSSSQDVLDRLADNIPRAEKPASGVPALSGDRAETLLLDLVQAGIENDFERVVFPEYPELREVKQLLLREGAQYASLSGSGSTLYGMFASGDGAQAAAARVEAAGHKAFATTTLSRAEYWKAMGAASDER